MQRLLGVDRDHDPLLGLLDLGVGALEVEAVDDLAARLVDRVLSTS
ncbi:MAG: hypothetical protein R3B82_14365 [Sandaracinaceae bacterium]